MMIRPLPATESPNILVIVTDDQGWGDIGYNNPQVYTPHMDRLAAEGAMLTQHYVMPQCTPTRLALFTGRYPGRFGTSGLAASNDPQIPHGTLTLASWLKSQGYATYLTGKWHMGSWADHGPNHHGFDYSYGALAGAVGAYDHRYRAGFREHPNKITWHRNHQIIPNYENGQHVTDLVTADAIRVIRGHEERDQPFFLYLPHFAPHTPLDERGRFVNVPTQLDADHPGRWLHEDQIEWFHDAAGLIQQEKDPEKRLFLAVLHHLDSAIGQVIEALEATGQRENTLILLSSDNGPQTNWNGGSYPDDLHLTDFNQDIPFRGDKTQVWEGGMRVPGIINWTGRIRPQRLDSVQHIIDWMPTIAGLINADLHVPLDQPALDGEDFSTELLAAEPDPSPREIYAVHRPVIDKWALRFGDWKIVTYQQQEPSADSWALFNLVNDPMESHDVAAEHPAIVADLHARFLAQRAQDNRKPNFPTS